MPVKGRLTQEGEFQIEGNIDTTMPSVTDGLVVHYPFDNNIAATYREIPSSANILAVRQSPTVCTAYNYFDSVANVTEELGAFTAITVEQALNYDMVILDRAVWGVSSAEVSHMKLLVDAGVSCFGVGNDARTNVFVKTYDDALRAEHEIRISNEGIINTGQEIYPPSVSSADVYGGIVELQNGALPEYYREDTGLIMGWSYRSPKSGAILYFDQEGYSVITDFHIDGFVKAYNATHTATQHNVADYKKTYDGVVIENATTNLYADGNFESKTPHPVRSGNWSFPSATWTPSGSQALRLDPRGPDNSSYSYFGRDIPITTGNTYAASCWCWVSLDNNSVSGIGLIGERGFAPNAYYDLSKKGTWQKLTSTAVATSNTARILCYDTGTASTRGYALFTDIQFEEKNYNTEFTETTRAESTPFVVDIPSLDDITVIGKFKPSTQFDGTYDYTANQSCMVSFHDTVGVGNLYYRYYVSGTTGSWPFLDPDGVYGTLHRHVNYELTTDDLYYAMTKTGTSLTFKIYQNGWKTAHTAEIGANPINQVRLGNASMWGGMHKSLTVYERVLSDDEIDKVLKVPYKVTPTGVIASGLCTTPRIPADAYYFDLGAKSDSLGGMIQATEDTCPYDDGYAFVSNASLEFNLFDSIDLDWSGEWSICYMKKPIGTSSGLTSLTGYNLDSIGCNSNSVGGGYVWWGKTTGGNSISNATNGGFLPENYFNLWQHVTVVKTGTNIRFETWLVDKVQRSRGVEYTGTAPNRFVTQYGYDLKLGGWDDNDGCHTYFANMIVLKRAMTAQELDDFRLVRMSADINGINIQRNIFTGTTLN